MHVPREGAAILAGLLALSAVLPVAALGPAEVGMSAQSDPSTDTLGWEQGYWHDEAIDVDPSDGLNDAEMDRVVARAMARVEAVRRIEFEEPVPVTIISREEYVAEVANSTPPSAADRLHQNAKFEALFFIDESTDAIEVLRADTAARTLGYYSPGRNEIVVVSPTPDHPTIDEITLAQELFHALQDQHFDAFNRAWYPGLTREDHNAADGVIEGDGNYVDYLYEQRCDQEWDCIRPEDSGGSSQEPPNFGVSVLRFAPYAEGPPFVQSVRQRSGWAGVNALYDSPTLSSEQFIHPEKYGEDEPVNVTVPNRSIAGWRVLDLEDSIDYAKFGEAGIFSMLWYPSYLARTNVIVPLDIFGEPAPGSLDYSHAASAGWDGDTLVPYINGSVDARRGTGYIWTIAWDTVDDAEEFLSAYRRLLEFHGGQALGNGNWRIDATSGFADAFYLSRDSLNVTIVNAPTVEELSYLRPDLIEQPPTTTAVPSRTTAVSTSTAVTSTDSATSPTVGSTTTGRTDAGPSIPGFGALLAIAAIGLALGLRRRGGA